MEGSDQRMAQVPCGQANGCGRSGPAGHLALSQREAVVTYTDEPVYFVSESNVYRLLKPQDLMTSLAYTLMLAPDKFQQPATRVNQM